MRASYANSGAQNAAVAVRPGDDADDIAASLRAAELQGLRIAIMGRIVVLAVMAFWLILLVIFYGPTVISGLSVVLVYLAASVLLLRHLRQDRGPAVVFAYTAAEIVMLGVFAATLPLAVSGGVPQIFIFRIYDVGFFLLFVATSALTLSPRLVLWSGLVSCATLWAVFLWIASGMERTVSWSDFPPGGAAADYTAILLSPDFVGTADRVVDTMVIMGVAGLIALAAKRARGFLQDRMLADARRLRTLEVFGQYVPPEMARNLVDSQGDLAPRTLEGSILFADIAGFTQCSETRPPEAVIAAMTDVFALATEAATREGGMVAGFAGDAVVVAFTFAEDAAASDRAAVRSAQAMQYDMAGRSFDGADLMLRIGIGSGPISAGSVGGAKRRAYTVYGDPVNLAQRLQDLGKPLDARLLICETTWRNAGLGDSFADTGVHLLRGKRHPVRVFRPVAAGGLPDHKTAGNA
jgi:class 3 adenylate cyclase